jgi:WD40 repeat protein
VSVSLVSPPPTPFKGLAPFEDSALDAQLFFGREREIEVIVANLMANRLTVLYGPSGVGKTSLLRAGLAQRLRKEPEAVVVVASSWGGDPVADLLDATEAALPVTDPPVDSPGRADSLADALESLVGRLDSNVYLVLDQFEEYFLYHQGESGPGTLIEELPEALRRRGLRANFLLGIREDSLAQLDAFKGRIPALFANTLRLDRLDRRAAEAAIVGPIDEYNRLCPPERRVEIEPALVEAVVREVAAGRVDLGLSGRGGVDGEVDEGRVEAPYLQLVLERLWEEESSRDSRLLRLDTLHELGGAARIVHDHLERAMAELSPREKDAAAAMYNHLVTPSGTKIAHDVGDLAGYAVVDEDEAGRVLRRLADQRIVRTGGDGGGGPRYEIFHDVLADAVLAWRTRHEADRRLESEREVAEERHRRTRTFAVAAVVAMAILAAISVYALTQRSNARSEARHARARELAARASLRLLDDPEPSLRLALQANELEPSRGEGVLRTVLRALRVQAVLPGGGSLADAAFSPEGRFVVTAGGGGEARIFRSDTGELVRTLRHGAPLTAAWFSPDGKKVVTAGGDIVRLWAAETGRALHTLKHSAVTSATFSPQGSVLATTSDDGSARLWAVSSGLLLHGLNHPDAVKSASFSSDGRLLVTVLADPSSRAARVFDVRSGRLVRKLVQKDGVTCAQFSPKGDLVVTGSGNGVGRVWDARTGKLRFDFSRNPHAILYAEFSPIGDRIVTTSTDQTGRVWDARTGEAVTALGNHTANVLQAHFSPDGKSVVTASADHRATVFDVDSGTVVATLVGHRDSVVDAVFNRDGTSIVSASSDGTARLWDPFTDPTLVQVGTHRSKITSLVFSPDGRLFASASEDGEVRVWGSAGHLAKSLRTGAAVISVVFSRDGSVLFASSADGRVRIWRTSDWSSVHTLRTGRPLVATDVSPDARFVATAEDGGVVRLWDVASGRVRRTLSAHGAVVVVFSPDGKQLVTAGGKVARVWRVDDGMLLRELTGHDRKIVAASFSPNGHRLVTASLDRTARTWDTETGELEHILRGHRGARITSASFSPDGRLVVTTDTDHNSRVWIAETGERLLLLGQANAVNGAAFSADGRWLVTAAGTAGVWQMSDGHPLFKLRSEDLTLLTDVAVSPTGWRIVTGGTDGSVGTYDCQLCGRVGQLVALAHTRLSRLRR